MVPLRFRKRLIGFSIFTTFLIAVFTLYTDSSSPNTLHTCSPADYAAGQWVYSPRTTKTKMTEEDDALEFSGFSGCASSREFYWHLASDKKDRWDRFPRAQSWKWVPGRRCRGLRSLDARELIKDLVEDGGWYLVGDSVMEGQFFSLSCILHGYVIATPDYTTRKWHRAWPQNLYLAPTSPLVASINFPKDFDITKTPLVTFRRSDLLFSEEELIQIHRGIQPSATVLEDDSLFGDHIVSTFPLPEALAEFFAPLPTANYKTMIVSTGGHWTVGTFSKTSPPGMDGVFNLFKHAIELWADEVEAHITAHAKSTRKQVVVRAYLPGHEDCHSFQEPWKRIQFYRRSWYNWGEIWKFNNMFDKLLSNRKQYPDIHYLGIDQPARLRPDAHTNGDCLHIMAGAGVLEGWSQYIWHYITRELVTDVLDNDQ